MTTPWRRVVLASYWCSSSDEHSEESSEYPQRAPPQSSFTLSPVRVIPKRSQVQHELPELTLDGLELLVDREVKDGTSEDSSESYSDSSSDMEVVEPSGEIDCWLKRDVRASRVALSYCVLIT